MLIVCSLFAMLAVAPAPVDTLRPGHRALERLTLRPSLDTVDVTLVSGTTKRPLVQTVTSITETTLGHTAAFLVTFVNASPRGAAWDSVWVDRKSFTPLRHEAGAPGNELHVRREGDRYVGTAVDSGKTTPVNTTFAQPLLDFSVLTIVAGYLPLAPGYRTWLAAWDFAQGNERIVSVQVIGEESIAGTGKAWKVQLDFGTHSVTSWYSDRSRLMVRGSVAMGSRGEMQMEARHGT
ncbi:MAG: hypothetical protein V4558_09665 [Gemmatimonadota bacterium]